jgi:hypothetical protein
VTVTTSGARALYVKNSGSIAILGATSSLSSTDAPAVEIRSAAVDVARASISGSRTATAYRETGLILHRITGRFSVSGGTISGARTRAVDIAHASNVTLRGLTFTDNVTIDGADRCIGDEVLRCNGVLVFEDVDGLDVENVRIDGSGQYGVSGLGVRNARFRDVSIVRAGDELDEHAMHFRNLGGTVRITGCTLTHPASRALYIENAKGEADVMVENVIFSGSAAPNGGQAILFETSGEARSRLTVSASSFEDLWTTSAQLGATDRATLDVTVRGNRFNRAGGIAVVGEQAATVRFSIDSNTIIAPTTLPISAQLPASSTGTLAGIVSSNTVKGARCASCGGVAVEGRGTGSVDVEIVKNSVSGVDGHGIAVVGQGSGTVRAMVAENTVTEPLIAAAPLPGAIRVQAGARPADQGTVCAAIERNRISGSWDSRGPVQLVNRTGKSRLLLAGYRGADNDAAAIGVFVREHNQAAGASVILGTQPEGRAIAGTERCGGPK